MNIFCCSSVFSTKFSHRSSWTEIILGKLQVFFMYFLGYSFENMHNMHMHIMHIYAYAYAYYAYWEYPSIFMLNYRWNKFEK